MQTTRLALADFSLGASSRRSLRLALELLIRAVVAQEEDAEHQAVPTPGHIVKNLVQVLSSGFRGGRRQEFSVRARVVESAPVSFP